MLFTVQRSVQEGVPGRILLPNGRFIDASTPSSLFLDPLTQKAAPWLQARVLFVRDAMLNKLNASAEQLSLCAQEFVCLKALLALDMNVSGISDSTAQMLSVARDSVQNALYLHLAERFSAAEAVARFGRMLLLLANVSVSRAGPLDPVAEGGRLPGQRHADVPRRDRRELGAARPVRGLTTSLGTPHLYKRTLVHTCSC